VKRLHIVGCHRSGTTLLHTLVTTCFAVDGFAAGEMGVYSDPPPLVGGVGGAVFVSKKPRDVRALRALLDLDRDLFALHVVRDPRAVIASRHAADPERYFTHLGAWLECERHAAAVAGHPRFHEVRYEDLVRSPDAVQAELARAFPFLLSTRSFSGFEHTAEPGADARVALGGLRPIATDRIDGWRAHLPRVKAQLERYRETDGGLCAALVRRGYEPDDAWTCVLDGVEAQHSRSRTPEAEGRLKRLDRRLREWSRRRRRLAALARGRERPWG